MINTQSATLTRESFRRTDCCSHVSSTCSFDFETLSPVVPCFTYVHRSQAVDVTECFHIDQHESAST